MANTAGPATFPGGMPQASPMYLVDVNGNPLTGSTGLPIIFQIADGVNPKVLASVGQTHNSNNQTLSNVNSLFTAGVAAIVSPIGTGNQQLEVGTDGAPSHGITSSTQNLAQTQSSNATGAITQGQTTNAVITPTTMTSGMVQFQEVDVDFGAANQEPGYIVSVTSTTITVQPVNGSPTAPSWKNAHSGTYKVQVRAYNIMRDIKGENSGFDGTGMPPAVEVEWASGGPPLASGLPSLDQYDRETLIVGQGSDSQAISSTLVGDAIITLTGAKPTLTPGAPVRLSGAALPETVYVDQSYILGNNTVIALKHPVVNAGQTLATWQKYTPNGPGTSLVSLYGEGMEGILLGDPGAPGFGRMMQANADNIVLLASGAITANGNSPDQTNVNYYTILTSATLTASAFQPVLSAYPGLAAVANVAVNDILPKTWRVTWQATAWGTGGSVLGISAALIV